MRRRGSGPGTNPGPLVAATSAVTTLAPSKVTLAPWTPATIAEPSSVFRSPDLTSLAAILPAATWYSSVEKFPASAAVSMRVFIARSLVFMRERVRSHALDHAGGSSAVAASAELTTVSTATRRDRLLPRFAVSIRHGDPRVRQWRAFHGIVNRIPADPKSVRYPVETVFSVAWMLHPDDRAIERVYLNLTLMSMCKPMDGLSLLTQPLRAVALEARAELRTSPVRAIARDRGIVQAITDSARETRGPRWRSRSCAPRCFSSASAGCGVAPNPVPPTPTRARPTSLAQGLR